ncbi:CopG family transcriptional regulator [Planomonospora parontospora]|nr:CopG family transcriptional regulator [Planomonospora parontospora]
MSGGTKKFSVTIPEHLAETVQERIGKGSFSAYVSEALMRQVERDDLSELIAAAETQHGPVDPARVEVKGALLQTDPGARDDDRTSAA